jgi:hypothetical protein
MTLAEQQDSLRERAQAVAAAARAARAWIEDVRGGAQSIGNEAESLLAEARRTESVALKLARSAGRRMCVGVYGGSQQGKSYLVSVLARPPGEVELRARFGAETRDFVKEINPQGGKESTGLVTRFTTAAATGASDPKYPVELLLLSETDLVKILANSFQSDFDQNNVQMPVPRGDEIRATIAAATKGKQAQPIAPHLDEIAISDLSDYFHKNFLNRWQELEPLRYWTEAMGLAPNLPLDARADLFSMLWGGLDDFTALFRLLAGALQSLGYADEVFTELRALVPRATSIIDVATLEQQLGTPADEKDKLDVRPRTKNGLGAAVELPRAVLTALVAELRITMNVQPWPMFEHTDLLDFPGARSRLKLTSLPSDAADRTMQVRQLLLRGKIAYLFQRYSEERELTAMLLCMGNKPNEVKDLGTLVRQWIELTHGATSAARRAVPTSLFLVLTMMDLEFLPKAGETDDALLQKWDVRLHTSLVEPYQHDGWVADFAGTPFNSTLMLRNPNFRQDHLVEYKLAPGSEEPVEPLFETGLARRNRGYIDKLEQSFMSSAEVAKHVANPREAWDAMFAFNDGGVSFIVGKLNGVSNPELKLAQVEQNLKEGASPLNASLKRFYFGVDEAARREKDALLRELRTALQRAFQRKLHLFPRFVARMMVSERDVREIALNVATHRIEEQAASAAPAAEIDIFSNPSPAAALDAAPRTDPPAVLGQALVRHWIGQIRRLPQEEAFLRCFGLSPQNVADIADQLIIGADRLKLPDNIAKSVRAATDLVAVRWEDLADRIVAVASFRFNSFIAELGNRERPMAERPGFPEGSAAPQRRVFEAAAQVPSGELPKLADAPEPLELRRFIDWGISFLKLGLDNLGSGGGRELSEAQNAALGQILSELGRVAQK